MSGPSREIHENSFRSPISFEEIHEESQSNYTLIDRTDIQHGQYAASFCPTDIVRLRRQPGFPASIASCFGHERLGEGSEHSIS